MCTSTASVIEEVLFFEELPEDFERGHGKDVIVLVIVPGQPNTDEAEATR